LVWDFEKTEQVKMAFLLPKRMMIVEIPEENYNRGPCFPSNYHAYWNPEVTRVVFAENGVKVALSDDAMQKIKNSYTGEPLEVRIMVGCCSCAGYHQRKSQTLLTL
jgi:hypothetical protein